MNKIKYSAIYAAFAASLGSLAIGVNAQAANLQSGDILTITAGVQLYDATGNPSNVTPGSYFGMDTNKNGVIAGVEKTPLAQGTTGLIIGTTTSAGASHGGCPTGGDINAIDAPWCFFGNAGSDFVKVTPITGGTGGLDMSGWTVTWNGIPAINMGSGAWGSGFSSGVANFTWDGVYGDGYTLDYHATVPAGDPSNFGGVGYALHLVGTVQAAPPPPINSITTPTSDTGTLGAGPTTGANADGTIGSVPQDSGVSSQCMGGCFDFRVTGLTAGAAVKVVLPLTAAIPGSSAYRKYANGSWSTFISDANNTVASAPGTGTDGNAASCPVPGDTSYTVGLSPGDRCVQLTITDGGPYDADGAADGTVTDPSGVGVPSAAAAASGHSGCSISTVAVGPMQRGDWWIVGGFLTWMGVLARRTRRS